MVGGRAAERSCGATTSQSAAKKKSTDLAPSSAPPGWENRWGSGGGGGEGGDRATFGARVPARWRLARPGLSVSGPEGP